MEKGERVRVREVADGGEIVAIGREDSTWIFVQRSPSS